MKKEALDSQVPLLLQIIDEAYAKKAWHGPNLKGSIRGLTAREAAWRPAPRRHNIWEIVIHATYWKYAIRRRLRGDKKGSFFYKGTNWFRAPISLTEQAWKRDVALLEQEHQKMREAIRRLGRPTKDQPRPDGSTSIVTLIYGVGFHDVYHAGQIQLLKRLLKTKRTQR